MLDLGYFGNINRPTWSFETVLENYSKTTLKAPALYLPREEVAITQKLGFISDIKKILEQIAEVFRKYSEELDTLIIPHPLLGKVTIREMFYLMSYHPLHHKNKLKKY